MKKSTQLLRFRDRDFFRRYSRLLKESKSVNDALMLTISGGAEKYYIEPESLSKIIYRINSGDKLLNMKPHKREMCFRLYNLYLEEKSRKEKSTVSRICSVIVEFSAPSFYIKHETARRIINKCLKNNIT